MRSDDVGYKKPPKKHQFKKGQSGNPKGRPKKSNQYLTTKDLDEMMLDVGNKKILIKENGQPVERKWIEVAAMKFVQKAMEGDRLSFIYLDQRYSAAHKDMEEKYMRRKALEDPNLSELEKAKMEWEMLCRGEDIDNN